MPERLYTCYRAPRGHIPRNDDCACQALDDSGFAQKQTVRLCHGCGRDDPGLGGCESFCDHGHDSDVKGVEVPRLCGPASAQRVVDQRIDTTHKTVAVTYPMRMVLVVVFMDCSRPTKERGVVRSLRRVSGGSMLLHRVAAMEVRSVDRGSEGKGCTKASKDGKTCRENCHDESETERVRKWARRECARRRRLKTMKMG